LLREAERRNDEFLAVLAHELRNPLAGLRNAAELLCRNTPTPRAEIACEILDRQLRQMTRLVDDLLDISRITAGRIDLQVDSVDIAKLLYAVETSLRSTFEASQQRLTLDVPAEPLHVNADRVRLLQVFSNLVQNAHKYTPRGGEIRIQLERDKNDAVVRVVDNGIGIPPDMLERVFEMFAQVDPSNLHARTGLGIGLTLARSLVQLHGGSIQAHSAGEGSGSEFIVRLPLLTDSSQSQQDAAVDVQPSVHRRILIADDNRDAAVSLSLLLEMMGHETRVVGDGVAAMELAETFRPDVVILDIEMPKLNGYEVARSLRERPWAQEAVLIALSGLASETDRDNSLRAGFDAHLAKPVAIGDIQAIVVHGKEGSTEERT
jgi:CheY-like chemotaxis protein